MHDRDFPPKTRIHPGVPVAYGYMISEEDPLVLIPDPDMVGPIKEALDAIDNRMSLREVAAWLTNATGKKISHQGINRIWKERRGTDPKNVREKEQKKARRAKAPKTGPDKAKAKVKRKLADAKRVAVMQKKKLDNWVDHTKEPEQEPNTELAAPAINRETDVDDHVDFAQVSDDVNAIFTPNPGPQTQFLAASEQEVLYGGSAGGGKSYGLLADPVRYFDHPEFNGLILRRTNDELRELVWKSQQLYPQAFKAAKWSERKSSWTFPSGGHMWMTYLERPEDVLRYQGQAFSYIAFDELTQHATPFAWNYMRSRLRTTAPDLPTYQRATTNPGGPGHCLTHGEVLTPDRGWVDIKEMVAGDAIYSVDASGNMFETYVDHTYKQWVDEDVVQVSVRGLNMSITQDHKVAKVGGTRDNPKSSYSLVPFSDLPGQATILRSVSYAGDDTSHISIEHSGGRKRKLQQPHEHRVEDYAALVGWYVSEGSRCVRDKAVVISQCKDAGREDIASLLDRMGYKYSFSETDFYIYCPSLYEHMSMYGDGCRNKRLTAEFKRLPTQALKEFFRTAMMGDGSGSYYYTTSHQLADDFSEVAIKIGRIVYVSQRQRPNREGVTYQVSTKATKSGGTELLTGNHKYEVNTHSKRKSSVRLVPYSGYVYCVGIPNTHTFIARQDGSVWVSGNTWVKQMFIDPAPANKAFWATDIDTGKMMAHPDVYPNGHPRAGQPNDKAGEPLFKRRFIPASLYDNPYLIQDDSYQNSLLSLPEHQRRQLLEGDWSVTEGAAFPEFRTSVHVVDPFEIPASWRRFRSCDYGYSSFSAVHWFAIDPAYEMLIVYRELYVSKHEGDALQIAVAEAERGENVDYGILDSSTWHNRGQKGPSIAEEMNNLGGRWRPSDRSHGARVAGKNQLHKRLRVDPNTERPGIIFFNTCRKIVATLPILPTDPKGGEDIDGRFTDDHAYDSVRYGVMSRPQSHDPFAWGSKHNNAPQPIDADFGY